MFWDNLFGPKKVGLVLAGGVARGLAHVGVLSVLKKHNIPIDYIAAASSGSLAALFFAAGMTPEDLEYNSMKLGWFSLLQPKFSMRGPFSGEAIQRFINERIGFKKFSDLSIPLAIVATDLKTGKKVVLKEGDAAFAVHASSAVPGIYLPVPYKDTLLVDGGVADNLPVDVVRGMGANIVIAVDVVPGGRSMVNNPDNVFQVIGQTLDIMIHKLSSKNRKDADFLIEPEIPEDVWHMDLHRANVLIANGKIAAEKMIPQIKARLSL